MAAGSRAARSLVASGSRSISEEVGHVVEEALRVGRQVVEEGDVHHLAREPLEEAVETGGVATVLEELGTTAQRLAEGVRPDPVLAHVEVRRPGALDRVAQARP